jgi:5-methylcytosine-specific restriction protein B
MNTADRSIALLDMALRRRFEFEEVVPDPDIIKGSDGRGWIEIDDGDPLQLPELLRSINRRINYFLGRDLMIGHAYLDKVRNIQDLHKVFAKKLILFFKNISMRMGEDTLHFS